MCLAKITKKSTANTRTKQESSMSNDALYHSFSSPSHLYFSVNGVEGIHFVEDQIIPQPSVVTKDEANSDSKVCSNCSSRILFSAKQCYRCGKAFCKNCCNQRVLDRSGRDDWCSCVGTKLFVKLCNSCYLETSVEEGSTLLVDCDCYSSHQSLLQKWEMGECVIRSVIDSVNAYPISSTRLSEGRAIIHRE